MAKKMLIDATHAEETRVVVVDGNKVEEFDFESENKRQLAGNIYLAKVTRVEPSLQAAFVDYGGNRHGFLAFSEVHPDYYQIPVADREALLAEERAYAKAQQEEDDNPKPKRTRSKSRSRSKAAKATTDDAVETQDVTAEKNEVQAQIIPGMDVVDIDLDDSVEGSSPMELVPETPVDTPAASEDDPVETSAVAIEDDASTDAEPVEATVAAEDATEVPSETDAAAAESTEAPTEVVSEEVQTETVDEKAAAQVQTEDVKTSEDDDTSDEDDDDAQDNKSDATDKDSSIESVAEEDVTEEIRQPRKPRPRRYKIQEVIKVRQILLVQVVKEERGNKGAALTTYLSLAGRYCVLMPNTARGGGISRKITNAADRKKLKDIANEIDVPEGAGLIIRTAGAKRTKTEIKRDYEYLQRMWEQIRALTLKSIAPAQIYEEGNLIKRSIRDLYNREIDEVFVEGYDGYRVAKDFMKMIMPSHAKNVKQYTDPLPLFARYQVETYLGGMFNPTVQLKSGGYIVIGVTEALVAIDVNSGRATKEGSIEDTALKTNLEAAEEVARQLRLRDLAGLIVIDFIDMEERKNNSAVEKRMKDRLKSDRARIQVGRISGFGLMEMSRQRLRPGMIEATTQPCSACHGTGLIRSDDNLALSILRQLEEEGVRRRSREVLIKAPIGISNFMMNQKREHIAQIEGRYGLSIRIEADPHLVSPDFTLERFKTATRVVAPASASVVSVDQKIMEELDREDEAAAAEAEAAEQTAEATPDVTTEETPAPKKRRRRRRRRRGSSNGENGTENESSVDNTEGDDNDKTDVAETVSQIETADAEAKAVEQPEGGAVAEEAPKEKPKRRRTRTRKKKADKVEEAPAEAVSDGVVENTPSQVISEETSVIVETATSDDTSSEVPEVPEVPEVLEVKIEEAPVETPEVETAVIETEVVNVALEPEVLVAPVEQEESVVAVVEPDHAPTPEPVPSDPPKPKRRGWWS
ncbi:MAG: Rne/Rng family ribonuclease [Pseudoruegeria sp.]